MKKINLFKRNISGLLMVLAVMIMALFSCNKDFENTLVKTPQDSTAAGKGARKTLMIIIDGAVGTEVRAAAPNNLTVIADFSIHSYDALSDFAVDSPMSKERGWSNLLTGVNATKHEVTDNNLADNNFSAYPSLFTHLKEKRPDWRTVAFTSSKELADNLAKDATEKTSFAGDDAAVKQAVISELNTKDPAFVLAQFSGVDQAGAAGSYSVTNAGYKAAILKADEYIGELLKALRSRKSFDQEDWIVIITSGKGSNVPKDPAGAGRSAYEDSRRNTLFFAYNPRFNSLNPTRPGSVIPYLGNAPLYDGNDASSRARVLDDEGTFDFGDQGSFSIQCKVKIKPSNYAYPAIFGKRASFGGGQVGWVFFLEGNLWQMNIGQAGQGNTQVKGQPIADDRWHTLTAVIKQEGDKRMVYTYTDGVYSGNSANIASKGNINSPAPLTVGFIDGSRNGGSYSPVGYKVTDMRIYDTALEAAYIASNFCRIDLDETDPYINNLIGFWPSTYINGTNTLDDLSGKGHDMKVDKLNAVKFNDLSTAICPNISEEVYRLVPNSVDAANLIYLWYGILIPEAWHLDGKSWIPTYTDING